MGAPGLQWELPGPHAVEPSDPVAAGDRRGLILKQQLEPQMIADDADSQQLGSGVSFTHQLRCARSSRAGISAPPSAESAKSAVKLTLENAVWSADGADDADDQGLGSGLQRTCMVSFPPASAHAISALLSAPSAASADK